MRFAIAGFIVPFMFIYGPAMVLQGTTWEIVMVIISGLLGTLSLAAAVQGWLLTRMPPIQRVVLFVGALCLIIPGLITDLIGFGLLVVILGLQWFSLKKRQPVPAK
jgi:TRAP-type uncharacterized transport system fused permease subunit